ncbi:hypothetical protein JQ557_17805 [Bradyrhizobium sp. U87765 SZCCT0131]|uniref:DUF6894 family protein n=1 Tax=unclassified Bradyrhizobium TaxID=2631580 RepID=UPI001BA7D7A7|nr:MULTISPECIES: hypothetical protein [unclassified Bradyrhizobium]MBR1219868.1 hypothetical protein [Bradyrhizobium sp. U87765 SZCCT0131]MBR1262519.1 hypothetical protein [Bradyrhizobium sp. U87765 SZCCT0134]MBR1308298.1 hypothetical protein [Bradyrhizobium sp. U87765 SZCCT0110]MBR1318301.1 hypothetical protein [Bradyrhizobium sp. U87765 SZCCT0109]MBR1352004.1 hypothetical protein [Bradyrhizobium sp. U87765 SZCCT0048]
MPRYYFHFKDGTLFRDEEGEDLRDVELARCHARRLALELASGGERAGCIEVADDSARLFAVPLPRPLPIMTIGSRPLQRGVR